MPYPFEFAPLANKQELLNTYKGRKLASLPTPSFVVDRKVFKENCKKMLLNASHLKAEFRAHVKTHKTVEGARLQLGSGDLKTDKIIVSTLAEAWGMLPLIEEGLITDILFGLPVVKSRLQELVELSKHVPHLRLMLDDKEQLNLLLDFSRTHAVKEKWSIFIKIDMGTNRAGFEVDDVALKETLEQLLSGPCKEYISLYGFYCHAGHSYASSSVQQARSFHREEIKSANAACKKALEIDSSLKLQLSVGATPTAHVSGELDHSSIGKLHGTLELHAGNYPFCDLQQLSTNCIQPEQISCRVLAEILSSYPNRGAKGPGELLVNAGVIALGREFGPRPGHGQVSSPECYGEWIVGRLSQEHGILTPSNEHHTKMIPLGTQVHIIPQHSCIAAAAYPYFFVVENGDTVVDIWVPSRGW